MMDWTDFGRRAAETSLRCAALVRHGARPPIDPEDPTFGKNLPITAEGRETALACGRALAASGPDPSAWGFLCSPLRRTRLTAEALAEGLGRGDADVRDAPEAGIPGLWIEDRDVLYRHYHAEGAIPFTARFVANGRAEGYRPVVETTRLALDWLGRDPAGTRLTLVCTHDVFAAAVLLGFGETRVNCTTWVGNLQGAALFEKPGGGWTCEWLVPDKTAWEAPFCP